MHFAGNLQAIASLFSHNFYLQRCSTKSLDIIVRNVRIKQKGDINIPNKTTKIVWDVLLKFANKYRKEAEACLGVGACYAALVSIRAALEAALLARFLLECFDFSEEELKEVGIKIIDDSTLERIEGFYFELNELIETIYSLGLITKQGREAAHRIRKWGNKIHATRVANKNSLPKIGKRNIEARLKDLDFVISQLLRTL